MAKAEGEGLRLILPFGKPDFFLLNERFFTRIEGNRYITLCLWSYYFFGNLTVLSRSKSALSTSNAPMRTFNQEIPRPVNSNDFEDVCSEVYSTVFEDKLPIRNGRSGQAHQDERRHPKAECFEEVRRRSFAHDIPSSALRSVLPLMCNASMT